MRWQNAIVNNVARLEIWLLQRRNVGKVVMTWGSDDDDDGDDDDDDEE